MASDPIPLELESSRAGELRNQPVELSFEFKATQRRTVFQGVFLVTPLQHPHVGLYGVRVEFEDLDLQTGQTLLRHFPLDADAIAAIRPNPDGNGFRLRYSRQKGANQMSPEP